MLTISFVNFIQVSVLTLTLFGIFLLISYKSYRQLCLLLALVSLSALFNLLEELGITRDIYLVTPIFILGFGPAIYLAIKGIIGKRFIYKDLYHFSPMLLALPFTTYPEIIIAIGTFWRILYSIASLKLLYTFSKSVFQERSDAQELSVKWLIISLSIMTISSALNLVRLNIQPYIDHTTNQIGQGVSTFIGLVFFTVLIRQLIVQKDAFIALTKAQEKSITNAIIKNKDVENTKDELRYFKNLFELLSKEVTKQQWHRIPRLTLIQLSELSGLQVRDISRAINLTTGENFNDYINGIRLNEVKVSITNEPDEAILSLALAAGFNSKSSFNKIFKHQLGVTPLEYRKSKVIKSKSF